MVMPLTLAFDNTGDRIPPISICNSVQLQYIGRENKKYPAKRAMVILMPVLPKAFDVVRHTTKHSKND
jgi:hypothetical protein